MRIGVVMEALIDVPLREALDWLAAEVPEITDLEIGSGGYAPHPHCDREALLSRRLRVSVQSCCRTEQRKLRKKCFRRLYVPGAGRISTRLRLYRSLVGAVSLIVTAVPLTGVGAF